MLRQWHQSGSKSEGSWIRIKKIPFSQADLRKISIFSGNFTIKSIFTGKFPKNFDFFRQFKKKFDFPGKNWSFTATSGQIILFLFKSHLFRTYFLYCTRSMFDRGDF